jgi:mRNA-degrading endonuclease RelE of RelBE toxin-antitoxin system
MSKKTEKKVHHVSEKKQQQMLAEELVKRTHCKHANTEALFNSICRYHQTGGFRLIAQSDEVA